jgi:hypothetical protein
MLVSKCIKGYHLILLSRTYLLLINERLKFELSKANSIIEYFRDHIKAVECNCYTFLEHLEVV